MPKFPQRLSEMPIVAAFIERDAVLRMQFQAKGFQNLGQLVEITKGSSVRVRGRRCSITVRVLFHIPDYYRQTPTPSVVRFVPDQEFDAGTTVISSIGRPGCNPKSIAERTGPRKDKVALARKSAVTLHAMWRTNTPSREAAMA